MKLSIQKLLLIRQRDFNVLNRAFSEGLGDRYTDQDYSLTREDAIKVAASIDRQADTAEKNDGFFPMSPDQQMQCIAEINQAAEAFRSLLVDFGL